MGDIDRKLSLGLRARFLTNVQQDRDGCWIWQAARTDRGYGICSVELYGERRAHRASYRIYKSDIPAGLVVMHSCDVPSCVNPEHLSVGTQMDNMRDKHVKGRQVYASGTRAGRSKLDKAQVIQIRRRVSGGYGNSFKLAAEYRISQQAMWKLINGRTYRAAEYFPPEKLAS